MKDKPNPLHQKETEWIGGVFFFEGTGLSPDDPEFKRRARRRVPPGSPRPSAPKKRGGKKPKK